MNCSTRPRQMTCSRLSLSLHSQDLLSNLSPFTRQALHCPPGRPFASFLIGDDFRRTSRFPNTRHRTAVFHSTLVSNTAVLSEKGLDHIDHDSSSSIIDKKLGKNYRRN